MDWTMINNASGPKQRIQTIFYLFQCRYELDAQAAGMRLAESSPDNLLCKQTVAELRTELDSPSADLGIVDVGNDAVRSYLAAMLATYDQRLAAE
jgi:hypothetical protein